MSVPTEETIESEHGLGAGYDISFEYGADQEALIEGTVTLPGSSTTSGVTVTAVSSDRSTVTSVATDSDGHYRFTENDLSSGTYDVLFRHDDGSGNLYTAEVETGVSV